MSLLSPFAYLLIPFQRKFIFPTKWERNTSALVNSAISMGVLGTDNREVQEQGGKLLSVRFSETIVLACFLLVNVTFVSFPCSRVQIQLRVFFTWLWFKTCAHIPYWPKFKHDIVNPNFSFTFKDLFHWILDPYLKVLVNHIFLPNTISLFFIYFVFITKCYLSLIYAKYQLVHTLLLAVRTLPF